MIWAFRPGRTALAWPLALVVLLGGCSGDADPPQPEASSSESLLEPSDAPTLAVEPVVSSGRIVGRLPRADRRRVEKAVSRVVVRWLDAAYLGGEYPRGSFRDSFPGFTPGARAVAQRDLVLMSNKGIGTRVDSVVPSAIRVRVDLLAVEKRAAAATAHLTLRFRTDGRVSRRYRVSGRLMLTRQDGSWRIFAYDVAKSHSEPGSGKTRRKQDERKGKDTRGAGKRTPRGKGKEDRS